MDGLARIAAAFAGASGEGRAALMPYYTLGYPDLETSVEVIHALSASGADLIELGVPFSDPLADGPTIQRSTQVALQQGMTTRRSLELTARLTRDGITQPLLLMGYYNPILAYGVERYVADAATAGAAGFIVPDLPPEEAATMEAACRRHELRPRLSAGADGQPGAGARNRHACVGLRLPGLGDRRDRRPQGAAGGPGSVRGPGACGDRSARLCGVRDRRARAGRGRRAPGRRRDRRLSADRRRQRVGRSGTDCNGRGGDFYREPAACAGS